MPIEAKWVGSPNKQTGRAGYKPESIVIHIMEGSLSGTDEWFLNPKSKVSAHYGVGRHGDIHQYVAEGDTAWHAGRLFNNTWKGKRDGVSPNLNTIGIEHEGEADTEWTDEMYTASAKLMADIANRWSIALDRDHVVGHREIYGKKTCPGSKVNLNRLVSLAREFAVGTGEYNFHQRNGSLSARTDLNIRKGAPTTASPVKRTAKAGSALNYVGWTSNGLSVNGNSHWYRTPEGDFFWAGATDRPVPGF